MDLKVVNIVLIENAHDTLDGASGGNR